MNTIFEKLSLDRNQIKWEDYLLIPTPIQKIGNMYFKREDFFAPLGYGGPNGSKMRQAIYLINESKKNNPKLEGIIGGTSLRSPQISMSSIIAKYYGLKAKQVIGATKPDTALKHYNIEIANYFDAEFYITKVAYNPALQKKVKELLNTYKNYYYLEYGITVDHKTHSEKEVENFHRIGAEQVKNIPNFIENIIIPAGSCNSCISVLYGLALYKPKSLKNVYLIGVGPNKIKYIEQRLNIISKVSGIETKIFNRYYYDHQDLNKQYNLETNIKDYSYNLHFYDLHKQKYTTYDKYVWKEYFDIKFHPTYEGKAFEYIQKNLPYLINDKSLFWIVGSLPSLDSILTSLNLPKKEKSLNIIGNEISNDFSNKTEKVKVQKTKNKNSMKQMVKKEKTKYSKKQTKNKDKKTKSEVKIFENNQLDQKIGRWSELNNKPEISDLVKHMDFRDPKYRREVFLRFYEFHLKYNIYSGCVYFAMPWLAKYYNMDYQTKLWMAYINGCSQNIVTTWLIMKKFPFLNTVNLDQLNSWWNQNSHKFKVGLGWDLDRKYFKVGRMGFPNCVKNYMLIVDKYGSQEKMFNELTKSQDPYKNFQNVWEFIKKNFISFGRLSAFSYTEYLKIVGVNIDCNNLFLYDLKGSQSHRNGLAKVLGRDDLDWWDAKESPNKNFKGYNYKTIQWLEKEAEILLKQAKQRFKNNKSIPQENINYFTLESTLCCYKSWHRPNRRYPNVYTDMFYQRIKYAESQWDEDFSIFWKMREECLPEYLLLEKNPKDPGLTSVKQNHYRLTGEVIMMDKEWSCFENEFNNNIKEK